MQFPGKVQNGIMVLDDRSAFVEYLKSLEGKDIEVEVAKYHGLRTHPHNNYYRGKVVTLMSDWTGFTPQEMHDTFKSMFLKETRRSKQGKAYDVVRSTTSLSTAEFADYVEKCRMFASFQGLNIPDATSDAPEAPELPQNSPPRRIPDETPAPTKEELEALFGTQPAKEPITITRLDGTKKTYD